MSKRRKALCAFALLMIVAGIVIAHSWFGLFSSPEYYKGFDWNTDKKKLEWRLSKDHYWYNDEEYKTNARKLEENTDIWFHDSYLLDKKTCRLKEIRLVFITDDRTKIQEIYETEVRKVSKKLGQGTECESYSSLYTEWRGKRSIIRVAKSAASIDDQDTYIEVVYQDKREFNVPFFTEAHIGQDVYEKMLDKFYCTSTPEYNAESIKVSKDTDYSNYKLSPTEETKKVVALINKNLFSGRDDEESVARKMAYLQGGITEECPMTVAWVMKHPAKSVAILTELTREDDFLKSRSDVDKAYEHLTDEEKRKS